MPTPPNTTPLTSTPVAGTNANANAGSLSANATGSATFANGEGPDTPHANGAPNTFTNLGYNPADSQNVLNNSDAAQTAQMQANAGMTQFNKNALGMPASSAYNAQNANQNFATIANGFGQAALPNGGQVAKTGLGAATNTNAASIAPLMMLNGGAQISTSADQQNASSQQQAINNLNNIASGNGPNAATIAAQQQAQQTTAQQMAAIASAGGNPALAARNAANAAATTNQLANQNAVLGSAQEQLGAQSTLQTALANSRAQGQVLPQAQAQLLQQANLANQGVQATGQMTQAQIQQAANAASASAQNANTLQQGSMNQQTSMSNQQALVQNAQLNAQQYNAMLGAQMQQSSYDTSQAENYQNAYQQAQENLNSTAAGQGIASMNNATQLTGATIGAVGSGLAGLTALGSSVSDSRAKTNIKSARKDITRFLNAMNSARTT